MKIEKVMRNRKNRYKGLTLLEVLIVIAIISLLSIISIISFGPVKEKTGLQSTVDNVSSTLNLAREYALQGKIPEGVTPGDPVCGFGFGFTNEDTYELFYYYPNDNNLSSCTTFSKVEKGVVTNQKLPVGATLFDSTHTIDNDYAAYFSIPFAKVEFYSQTDPTFKVKYGNGSSFKTVSVDSNGLIQ